MKRNSVFFASALICLNMLACGRPSNPPPAITQNLPVIGTWGPSAEDTVFFEGAQSVSGIQFSIKMRIEANQVVSIIHCKRGSNEKTIEAAAPAEITDHSINILRSASAESNENGLHCAGSLSSTNGPTSYTIQGNRLNWTQHDRSGNEVVFHLDRQ